MSSDETQYKYSVEHLHASIDADTYIREYNDVERFLALCRECPNFGRVWACPPLSVDPVSELSAFDTVSVFATKIFPERTDIPISEAGRVLVDERRQMERHLRELERKTSGRALAFAGKCLYCPEGSCTRPLGRPCRHSDLVRPSLEAYGFDLGKTAERLLGFPLLWSDDGYIPRYLTLIGAVFHRFSGSSPGA